MGQFSTRHILVLMLDIAMWVGAAAVIVIVVRKIGLFNRRSD